MFAFLPSHLYLCDGIFAIFVNIYDGKLLIFNETFTKV